MLNDHYLNLNKIFVLFYKKIDLIFEFLEIVKIENIFIYIQNSVTKKYPKNIKNALIELKFFLNIK